MLPISIILILPRVKPWTLTNFRYLSVDEKVINTKKIPVAL